MTRRMDETVLVFLIELAMCADGVPLLFWVFWMLFP